MEREGGGKRETWEGESGGGAGGELSFFLLLPYKNNNFNFSPVCLHQN